MKLQQAADKVTNLTDKKITPNLILASTSVFRKELLSRLQVPFTALAPLIDEDSHKDGNLSPTAYTQKLAFLKADSLSKNHPEAVIIGSDQAAFLPEANGSFAILEKPHTKENAVLQLEKLAGRTHQLVTSLCVIYGQKHIYHTDVSELTMLPLSTDQIKRYVEKEPALNSAGSYKLEGLGISLFAKIRCEDSTAIIGLPLMALTKILNDLKVICIP